MFMNNTYPFKKPEVEKTKMSENFKMVRQPTMLNTDTQTTNDAKSSTAATAAATWALLTDTLHNINML